MHIFRTLRAHLIQFIIIFANLSFKTANFRALRAHIDQRNYSGSKTSSFPNLIYLHPQCRKDIYATALNAKSPKILKFWLKTGPNSSNLSSKLNNLVSQLVHFS